MSDSLHLAYCTDVAFLMRIFSDQLPVMLSTIALNVFENAAHSTTLKLLYVPSIAKRSLFFVTSVATIFRAELVLA